MNAIVQWWFQVAVTLATALLTNYNFQTISNKINELKIDTIKEN